MKHLRLALLTLAAAATVAGSALAASNGASTGPLPHWLPAAEHRALNGVFGGAKPIHTYSISYPRKIAVIFAFNHVVLCGGCSAPTNASIPRGRVIRVSFDRATHRLTGTMEFCESRGAKPSRARCLRR
jgi:hypothetical protein